MPATRRPAKPLLVRMAASEANGERGRRRGGGSCLLETAPLIETESTQQTGEEREEGREERTDGEREARVSTGL